MKLSELIEESTRAVVFSGAGVSTESGLRDFRGSGGRYEEWCVYDIAHIDALNENPEEVLRYYRYRIREMRSHAPNQAHRTLSEWEKDGLIEGIITQNVDRYHELSGTKNVAKLHGDLSTCTCMICGGRYDSKYLLSGLQCRALHGGITGTVCNGYLRPNVVLFGENLPNDQVLKSTAMLKDCDLFIVLGSSLRVHPANKLLEYAKEGGAKIVIINSEPTKLDHLADLVIYDQIGKVLAEVDKELKA